MRDGVSYLNPFIYKFRATSAGATAPVNLVKLTLNRYAVFSDGIFTSEYSCIRNFKKLLGWEENRAECTHECSSL